MFKESFILLNLCEIFRDVQEKNDSNCSSTAAATVLLYVCLIYHPGWVCVMCNVAEGGQRKVRGIIYITLRPSSVSSPASVVFREVAAVVRPSVNEAMAVLCCVLGCSCARPGIDSTATSKLS